MKTTDSGIFAGHGEEGFSMQKALPFWDKLTPEEKELVLNNTMPAHYAKGQLLLGYGSECLGVLLIRHGCVNVYMLSDEGREITLYRLREGDVCVLSASCVLKQITFEVHVEAEEDTSVMLLNASTLNKLMSENVWVENFAYKLTAERFSEVMWAMQQMLFLGFDKRLANYLYDESANVTDNKIHTTHEQIARHIGSAREVVTRMLNRFADSGVVELQRGVIIIKDEAALKKLIG